MRTRNHSRSAQRFSSRAQEALRQANIIRTLLTHEPAIPIPADSLPEDSVEEIVDSADDNGDA